MKPKGRLSQNGCPQRPSGSGQPPDSQEGRGRQSGARPEPSAGLPFAPMKDKWQEQRCGCHQRWLPVAAALMIAIMVSLIIPLIYFAVRANSEACQDGLRAQRECQNATHLLQLRLTRTQDSLRQVETREDSCNRTVVTLRDSLEQKGSQIREQEAQIRELESKVKKLNQELEKLRTSEKESGTQHNSASSKVVSILLMLTVQQFLFF